jgi:GalNAc-alpha-(1->4)-GalNAc-alpha-(1->3)-diNAcBac-PP-undecaprenol alpha-1,4-N-acetyl-D-galactosaminyltransferase
MVISSLSAGGAERVFVELACAWAESNRFKPIALTLSDHTSDFYALNKRVQRIPLALLFPSTNLIGALRGNMARVRALRRALRAADADVIVAFGDTINVLALLSAFGLGLPVIACEHIDPAQHSVGRVWGWLRRRLYPRAAAVTVLTEAIGEYLAGAIPELNVKVMPNPIPAELAARPVRVGVVAAGRPRMVAMGRLGLQKGFDMLIESFARVANQHSEWDLWIWGEGELRVSLENQIALLGLEARVFMPGRTSTPWDELEKAELVVLSSRFEGLPMVMLEAMALGRAVVAFDCPSGPRELSREGRDAVLVPKNDVGALAGAMGRLMIDEGERRRMGQAALSVRERYSLERVLTIWDDVLSVALKSKYPKPM